MAVPAPTRDPRRTYNQVMDSTGLIGAAVVAGAVMPAAAASIHNGWDGKGFDYEKPRMLVVLRRPVTPSSFELCHEIGNVMVVLSSVL